MTWQQGQIPVEDAKGRAPSNALTVTGEGVSADTSACAVTDASGCDAQNAAALDVTRSAEMVEAARVWLDADAAWWSSLMRGPFNERKSADHWRLAAEAAAAWERYTSALDVAGLEVGDRRQFARELVGDDH